MNETGTDTILRSNEGGYDLRGRFIAGTEFITPLLEQIAQRAYFIFLRSSRVHGNDLKHWLLAEAQLKAGVEPQIPHETRASFIEGSVSMR